MEKSRKEEIKNWLETGVSETDLERTLRQKKESEEDEKVENLITYGENRTDEELLDIDSLKKVTKELLDRFYELKQLEMVTPKRKNKNSINILLKLVTSTLDEIKSMQDEFDIDIEQVRKDLDKINLQYERIRNYKETKLKETNKQRAERKRSQTRPSEKYEGSWLTPRDKDY